MTTGEIVIITAALTAIVMCIPIAILRRKVKRFQNKMDRIHHEPLGFRFNQTKGSENVKSN